MTIVFISIVSSLYVVRLDDQSPASRYDRAPVSRYGLAPRPRLLLVSLHYVTLYHVL